MLAYLLSFCNGFPAHFPSTWCGPASSWPPCHCHPLVAVLAWHRQGGVKAAHLQRSLQDACPRLLRVCASLRSMTRTESPTRDVPPHRWFPSSTRLPNAYVCTCLATGVTRHATGIGAWTTWQRVSQQREALYEPCPLVWGDAPLWFGETHLCGLGRRTPVVWRDAPLWFGETRSVV